MKENAQGHENLLEKFGHNCAFSQLESNFFSYDLHKMVFATVYVLLYITSTNVVITSTNQHLVPPAGAQPVLGPPAVAQPAVNDELVDKEPADEQLVNG